MNILVTGGRGQLGCSIQSISADYPQHRFVFTDMPELDITDSSMLESVVAHNRIDAIVNCAAYTAVDRAESEQELAYKINVDGARVLASVAKASGVRLIHISTDYVFSGEGCHPLREGDPTGPTGVYGQTKLEGEMAIHASGCDAAIVRTAWLYSEFGANFVKTMLRVGAERGALNVVYDQVGTPTYAPDLARAIMVLLERGVAGFEIYHFSNEGVTSWYDFAKEIFALSELEVCVKAVESSEYPTDARRPAYSVLSKDKIKRVGVAIPYWHDSLVACLHVLTGTCIRPTHGNKLP